MGGSQATAIEERANCLCRICQGILKIENQFQRHRPSGQDLFRSLMSALEMMEAISRRFRQCQAYYSSEAIDVIGH